MARYIGPVCRLCRREDMKLFLKGDRCYTDKCGYERRSYPPGQHGQGRKRKASDYGEQLREKQKVKRLYGIAERQFRGYYFKANRMKGVTGENLLVLLERRLDNIVYRLGFAGDHAEARQLVRHGHFMVNGRKTNIPSFLVKSGDVVTVRPGSRSRTYFTDYGEVLQTRRAPDWMTVDASTLSGRILNLPSRDQIEVPTFNEALVVEHYSR